MGKKEEKKKKKKHAFHPPLHYFTKASLKKFKSKDKNVGGGIGLPPPLIHLFIYIIFMLL